MYGIASACPVYRGPANIERLSLSIQDCKVLINELHYFLRIKRDKSGNEIKTKAKTLIQYWLSLDFTDSISQSFKDQGIDVLNSIRNGSLVGFDAEFCLHSCIGYFNQNFRSAQNLSNSNP
jgi:hypothetical protein